MYQPSAFWAVFGLTNAGFLKPLAKYSNTDRNTKDYTIYESKLKLLGSLITTSLDYN